MRRKSLTETSVRFYVPDCDAVFEAAVKHNGEMLYEITDMPYGERSGNYKGPVGQSLAYRPRRLPKSTLQRRCLLEKYNKGGNIMDTAKAKTNNLATAFIGELRQESVATLKCLERIPKDKFGWQPHERSMTLGRLATHIAEMSGWVAVTATTDELDFNAKEYKPFDPQSTSEIVELFDTNLKSAIAALENLSDEEMMKDWTLRNGEQIYFTMPKIQCLRGMCFNHIVHHRGQLTVYLRLNDIPVPAVYGPSADEGQM